MSSILTADKGEQRMMSDFGFGSDFNKEDLYSDSVGLDSKREIRNPHSEIRNSPTAKNETSLPDCPY